MNHQADQDNDHDIVLSSQTLYPGLAYTQTVPQREGEGKARRQRKKSKSGRGDEDGVAGLSYKKRKLSEEQVNFLEMNFENEHKLESERKDRLASELGLDPRQVAVWFQNRRARWKNKKLEEEYSNLKKAYDSVVVEKFRFESQIMKLKEQLSEAEKEIQRLSERCDGATSNSTTTSSSSLCMDARTEPALFDGRELGDMEEYENVFNYVNGMEWINGMYIWN